MGASASLMESLTPEQQEAMKAKYDALIAEGKTEEEAVAALQAEGVPPAAEAPAAEAPAAEAPAEGEAAAAPAEGEAAPAAEAEAAAAAPANPKKIIIAGAPASGKGTQCERIREEFKCVHLSTGDMLRAAVAEGSELGLEADKVMKEGGLVADETMIGIILARLEQEDCKTNGWLLDGFPRTGAQADALKEKGIECDAFIYLEVPDEVLLERVTGRRLDPETNTIYHLKFKPPPEDVAERCTQRSDDTEEKLKPRLEAFHANLESILGAFTDKMMKLDGNREPDTIWEEIKAGLTK